MPPPPRHAAVGTPFALHTRRMKRRPRISSTTGFTLVELMVSISIFGLILAASAPSFSRFLQSWKLSGEVNQLATTLRMARSAAVIKNVNTVFEFNEDAGTYSYYEDTDGDGVRDAAEFRSGVETLDAGIHFDSHTFSTTKVTFGPKGNANESGDITMMNSREWTRTVSVFGGTGNIRAD